MNALRCRHCGQEILSSQLETRYDMNGGKVSCRLRCGCGASTPWGEYCKDREKAIEAAFLAATSAKPNPPLNREQVMEMRDLDAVWIVNAEHIGIKPAAWLKSDIFADIWAEKKLYFAAPPSTADIEAARKGRSE